VLTVKKAEFSIKGGAFDPTKQAKVSPQGAAQGPAPM